jgi:hypothetical protein
MLTQVWRPATLAQQVLLLQPGQGIEVVQTPSEVAVGAVDSYSVVALHVVAVVQTRFEVTVGVLFWHSLALHVVVVVQTRLYVAVGTASLYCRTLNVDMTEQTRFDVAVGAVDSNC